MPLMHGRSKEVIAENIRTLRHEGRKEDQAIAIAYSKAGLSKKRSKKPKVKAKKPKDSY